jgi:hypothetical protein
MYVTLLSSHQNQLLGMKHTTLTTILLFVTTFAFAQLRVNNTNSKIEIDGTSNVHDWTEKVETINGTCNAQLNGTTLVAISSLDLTMPVRSIKSGKGTMDKNTYNALNADKYPNIVFKLKSASVSGNKVVLTGTLTIAGKAQNITVNCSYATNGSALTIKGEHKMKMTQFGIDPPTAMLGAMTTGDDITIRFNIVFN